MSRRNFSFVCLFVLSIVFVGVASAAQYGWYTEGNFEPAMRIMVAVVNTLDIERRDCPVVIPWECLPVRSLEQTWLTVVDPTLPPQPKPTLEQLRAIGSGAMLEETNGHSIPYQLDDLDKDGVWDELFFMTDFKPKETKIFLLYFGANERGGIPHQTHAGMGTYGRHLVPWWESKHMGWKLWYPNSVDLYGKRKPMLVANLEGSGEISGYTAPEEYGSDILTVAKTFGAGGICLSEDPSQPDKISCPRFNPFAEKGPVYGARFAYDVIVNGPLRSMIRAHTMNWRSGKGEYELEQLYTAYKDKSYSTCKVHYLKYLPDEYGTQFGCGMRKIMNEYKVFKDKGVVISFGKDLTVTDPDVDPAWETKHIVKCEALALVVKDKYKPTYLSTDQYDGNHVMRMPVTDDHTYEYLIAAGWSEGTVNKTEDEFKAYVLEAQKEYNNPIKVGEVKLEKK